MTKGNVIQFRPRRTYLDACHERGVFQECEELIAENAELQSRLANVRKEASAKILALGGGPDIVPAANKFETYRDDVPGRLQEYLNAFEAVIGGAYVPLLRHLLLNTEIPGALAESTFTAALQSDLQEGQNVSESQDKPTGRQGLAKAVEASLRRRSPGPMTASAEVADPKKKTLADAVARMNKRRG